MLKVPLPVLYTAPALGLTPLEMVAPSIMVKLPSLYTVPGVVADLLVCLVRVTPLWMVAEASFSTFSMGPSTG